MTSFVREILSAAGNLDSKEALQGRAQRVQTRLDAAKAKLRAHVQENYKDHKPQQAQQAEARQEVRELEAAAKEVDELTSTVNGHLAPQMDSMGKEMRELLKQLSELSATVQVANRIKDAYMGMEAANACLEDNKYLQAAKQLAKVQESLNADPGVDLEECDRDQMLAFDAVRNEMVEALESIHLVLGREFDRRFTVVRKEADDGTMESAEIAFHDVADREEVAQLVQAMQWADMLSYRLSKFGVAVMGVLKVVVDKRCLVEVKEKCVRVKPLGAVPKKKKKNKEGTKTDPAELLASLEKVFKMLASVLSVPTSDEEDAPTCIQLLGESFSEELTAHLIKECLLPAVPDVQEQLDEYETVVEKTKKCEDAMRAVNFLPQWNTSLTDFTSNLEATFADKRIATILGKAREYMKEDLHIVEEIDPSSVEGIMNQVPELENLHLPEGTAVEESLVRLQRGQVSKHVFKVMKLVRSTMEEATRSNTFLAGKLIHAARLTFDLYRAVLTVYHKDSVSQFPQNAALALTNCLFLAHQCVDLSLEFRDLVPEPLRQNFVTFADLIMRVRGAGIAVFLEQLQRQRDTLKAILLDSGFSQLTGEDDLPPKTEQSVKQILHGLHHLRKVWQHVLPPNIYSRAIGVVLNTVVEELILRVVKLEDIAADAAVQIFTLFTTVCEKAPEVFVIDCDEVESSPHDVNRFVKSWQKFKELMMVLNARLREIDERWANGKGPLSAEFSVEEMKHLIRALFQNSERRAAVLASIKYEG